MRLREIKLAGFKSFVDPTTVTFPGNRCAVVGPNGCGKSNIVDAVRWVLGESSARQLRGEALTDVIFNGSTARQPMSLASIELVFDNTSGRVDGEFAKGKFASYAEIAIRREVNRDSVSSYFLNGTRCRRRDVADVFLGTGFGPRSYSIIEQGMVSQLVVAKPDELRAYLEEAAGISKYRERRRETQNRIKHTVENLERLSDIIDELDRQLAHLKRQARAAERYRDLKDQERHRSAELHALRLTAICDRLAGQETRLGALDLEHEAALGARQSIDTALERNRAAHTELSDEQGEVQGRYYGVGADVARLEQTIEYNTERIGQFNRDLEDLAARQRETKSQLDADAERIGYLNAELASRKPHLATSEADDSAAAARLEEVEQRGRSGQRAWEDYARRVAENDRETQVRQSRSEHVEQVLQRLRARAGTLETEPGRIVDASVERLARQVEESTRRVDALNTDIAANARALADSREEAALRERARDDAREEAQALRREQAALAAVQQAAVGKSAGANDEAAQWLRDHGLDEVPRLGEQLAVEAGWEPTVEAVLGSAISAVAVQDTSGLAGELARLARGRIAVFEAGPSPAIAGELPPLADLVANDVGSLLAGIFAADSLESALRCRGSLAPGQSIVTREGVWLGTDWIRLDKGVDEGDGVVGRARQMEVLEDAVKQADARFAERLERLAETRERLAMLEQERDSLQARHATLSADLGRLTTDHGVRQVRMEEADARARRNAAEREEIGAQIEAEAKELAHCRTRLAELLTDAEQLRTEGDALRGARQRDAEELEQARRVARETRDAFHQLRVEYQGLEASLSASETARERLIKQGRDFGDRAGELRTANAEIEAATPGHREALEAKLAESLGLEGELAEIRRKVENVEAELGSWTVKRNEAEATVDHVRGRVEDARVERERLIVNRDTVQAQLAETGIELAEAQGGLPEDATEEGWVETLERLAGRIARLGPINLAAIDEYETQSERKRYLDRQREDLETALNTLRNAIRRIDRETRTRFKDTFDKVNEHLKTLFPKFFGGGHAYLVHTGEDWLDTGVTLMARPPGKRNSSIHQLSGGEKAMTAVALIFSIFQLNPSPVCLLDEVDAPLDDVNVDRFAQLIREMSNDVQFVVITHNKQTIEMADHLLGVTMQEPGVSRLVSVDMERAARLVAV